MKLTKNAAGLVALAAMSSANTSNPSLRSRNMGQGHNPTTQDAFPQTRPGVAQAARDFLKTHCLNPIIATETIPLGTHQLCNNGTLKLNTQDEFNFTHWDPSIPHGANPDESDDCNRYLYKFKHYGDKTLIVAQFMNLDAQNDSSLMQVDFGEDKTKESDMNDMRHPHCNGLITGINTKYVQANTEHKNIIVIPDIINKKIIAEQDEVRVTEPIFYNIDTNDIVALDGLDTTASFETQCHHETRITPFSKKGILKKSEDDYYPVTLYRNNKHVNGSEVCDLPDLEIGKQIRPLNLPADDSSNDSSDGPNKASIIDNTTAIIVFIGAGLIGAYLFDDIKKHIQNNARQNNPEDTGFELQSFSGNGNGNDDGQMREFV